MAGEVLARVRYKEFSEPPERSGLRTRSLKKKQVMGPSGASYSFRQQGRPTNPNSQWLPIRNADDVEFFEGREGFEVKRER
jgi:hypothetical protein